MISAQDFIGLFKLNFIPHYITRNQYGSIGLYKVRPRWNGESGKWITNGLMGEDITLPPVDIVEFQDKVWTECLLEINKTNPEKYLGCLCWFAESPQVSATKELGILSSIEYDDNGCIIQFNYGNGRWATRCSPALESEITFFKLQE